MLVPGGTSRPWPGLNLPPDLAGSWERGWTPPCTGGSPAGLLPVPFSQRSWRPWGWQDSWGGGIVQPRALCGGGTVRQNGGEGMQGAGLSAARRGSLGAAAGTGTV